MISIYPHPKFIFTNADDFNLPTFRISIYLPNKYFFQLNHDNPSLASRKEEKKKENQKKRRRETHLN